MTDTHQNSFTMRVMWLLNHGTARRFEIDLLKRIGIKEIYLPKIFPNDPGFRSASVDYSEDKNLSIPEAELEVLNRANWYEDPGPDAWKIANKYFDVIFFIVRNAEIIESIAERFKGVAIWRTYGLDKDTTYSKIISSLNARMHLEKLGNRFFFGQAYEHLHTIEDEFLARRSLYLPLGMHNCTLSDNWSGNLKKIFFVCPDIGFNSYYKSIYENFVNVFSEFPYAIGGAQPIRVNDKGVLGFVPTEAHEHNMREMRVMFYHSSEPYHIHYHPFEAIRAGMPLVFMANGLLDSLGGKNLPGRCRSVDEAKKKISRILQDDWELINSIRSSQVKLLDPMKPENCLADWQEGFNKIHAILTKIRQRPLKPIARKRIAVILAAPYKGGSLRGAKLAAHAIYAGSRESAEPVDVIFAYPDAPLYSVPDFSDLPTEVQRRPYNWKLMDHRTSRRAVIYAKKDQSLSSTNYQVPDDGINHFLDCDLWLIISDRLENPVLPLRPYILMVFDYLQRYVNFLAPSINRAFIDAAQKSKAVLVTTEFTRQDAIQFAGIPAQRIIKVPMLAPMPSSDSKTGVEKESYFLWPTNLGPHKNHLIALTALRTYYERHRGQMKCKITGIGTKNLLNGSLPNFQPLSEILSSSELLRSKICVLGELSDANYIDALARASFLWHPGEIDNGTFCVVEAACVGTPSLSSGYPAMIEMESQFNLGLTWMDQTDPEQMANQLSWMEANHAQTRSRLPTRTDLSNQSVEKLSTAYWKAIRKYL